MVQDVAAGDQRSLRPVSDLKITRRRALELGVGTLAAGALSSASLVGTADAQMAASARARRTGPGVARRLSTVRYVRNGEELRRAFDSCEPGDEVVLRDGRYNSVEAALHVGGNEELPILVRAEHARRAVFTGTSQLRVAGAHITIRDLSFHDCIYKERDTEARYRLNAGPIALDGATHSRVTACDFRNIEVEGSGAVILQNAASFNRIDHNRFRNVSYRCVWLGIYLETERIGPPRYNRIDHNLFREIPPSGHGSAETVQLGQWGRPHSAHSTFTTVENNIFLRCNGENEIISVKTSDTIIRNNLFQECDRGELVLRSADRATIDGNRIIGSEHGIRASGSGHRIVNNVVIRPRGTGIRLTFGTEDLAYPTGYMEVHSTVVANNTVIDPGEIGIHIGMPMADRSNSEFTKPPFNHPTGEAPHRIPPHNCIIVNNLVSGSRGRMLVDDGAPDNFVSHNLLYPTSGAERGSPEPGRGSRFALTEAPQFRDPAAGDFRLRDTSPARGAGMPILGPDSEGLHHIGASAEPFSVGPDNETLWQIPADVQGQ